MYYCVSDIHGRIDLFEQMLDKIDLQGGDMLYVLGDCIDRGGGIKVLQRIKQLSDDGKAMLIMGNHEYRFLQICALYRNDPIFENLVIKEHNLYDSIESNKGLTKNVLKTGGIMGLFCGVLSLSGDVEKHRELNESKALINNSYVAVSECESMHGWESLKELFSLPKSERNDLIEFLQSAYNYIHVPIGDKMYCLVHGGLHENYIERMNIRDKFYTKPVDRKILTDLNCQSDSIVVFGHSTTRDINIITNHTYIAPQKIWFDEKYHDKIGIDCGACYPNGQLACLRLDDMQEYYVENKDKCIVSIEKLNSFLDNTVQMCNQFNTANN